MANRLMLLILLLSVHWIRANAAQNFLPDPKLKKAIALLGQTRTGAEELKLAEALGIPMDTGSVSKTDITASRSSEEKGEQLHFTTKVSIAADKEPVFQALDLAHELTHAIHPKSNPFDPNLSAQTYVKTGIEGEGGEAEAIAKECAVGKELSEASPALLNRSSDALQLIKARCQFVWNTAPDRAIWNQSFYFLGQYYREFTKSVLSLNESPAEKNRWISEMQTKSPIFASALAHKPYPVALFEEYLSITRTVCARASKLAGRDLAALTPLKNRCLAIGAEFNP